MQDSHSVLDLEDLHASVAPDEFGEDALVVRGQVLDQNKGHAGIDVGRHAGKEGFEGSQPTGGSADADNGKALLRQERGRVRLCERGFFQWFVLRSDRKPLFLRPVLGVFLGFLHLRHFFSHCRSPVVIQKAIILDSLELLLPIVL